MQLCNWRYEFDLSIFDIDRMLFDFVSKLPNSIWFTAQTQSPAVQYVQEAQLSRRTDWWLGEENDRELAVRQF